MPTCSAGWIQRLPEAAVIAATNQSRRSLSGPYRSKTMPLIQIKEVEGYLSLEQKQEIIRKVTDAGVSAACQ